MKDGIAFIVFTLLILATFWLYYPKCSNCVTDVIYNPKDSSWHLDIATDKDTVEVPVDAQTAAKFTRR